LFAHYFLFKKTISLSQLAYMIGFLSIFACDNIESKEDEKTIDAKFLD
jgi:hypothetical protein